MQYPILVAIHQANNEKQILLCEPNYAGECANLRLSASEASGTYRDPWQFIVETKNSVKNDENFQQCAILEPLYNKVRTHFITQSR